jgi:CubicO group peptidase (beta-lactamase class C family)
MSKSEEALKAILFPFKFFYLLFRNLWIAYGLPNSGVEDFHFSGHIDPDYQEVADLFKSYFKFGGDDNSQLCVFVGENCVLDVYGGRDADFGPNSLVNIWSSGKSIASVLMAKMHDDKKFHFSDKVTKYWPEFGKNGKENIKIEDVMRHEAGMSKFGKKVKVKNTWPENIKRNKIGKIIENEKIERPLGYYRAYHATTRDWISNEIFRRVES